MRIVVKTLQGKQLPLEVDESDTVIISFITHIPLGFASKAEDRDGAQDAGRPHEAHRLWKGHG